MLGLVLLLITWSSPDFDRPSGPRFDRHASLQSAASLLTCSICPVEDCDEESIPPSDSLPDMAADEIEVGGDFEGFDFALPLISNIPAPPASARLPLSSTILALPSPKARSPRLRC
jgi:hypothetical protein